jgi:hypothetical protein
MREHDHFTHNRARDLRSKYTSEAARRDEDYYDTDYFDADFDDSLEDIYELNYDKEFQGGYHQRTGEGNYGRVKIPRSGFNADFDVYDDGDRSDYDRADGLDIDRDIERHYRYDKVHPRHRNRHYAPSAPRRRRH